MTVWRLCESPCLIALPARIAPTSEFVCTDIIAHTIHETLSMNPASSLDSTAGFSSCLVLGADVRSSNTSLPCDPTLFQMSNTVDNYFWELDNVTDLCTGTCYEAVDAWRDDVQIRCALDSLAAYGKAVPAYSVAGRYAEGLNIACLTNQK